MKKRIVIIIGALLIIVLVLFLPNLYKINLIEEINKVKEKSKFELGEITIVDVTDLDGDATVSHLHAFKTMYDENAHWEECTICNEIKDRNEHQMKTVWAMGTESCYPQNFATSTCTKCGYSYEYRKECVWDGTYVYASYSDFKNCVSKTHGFHYVNGGGERCYTSYGIILDCLHGGRCVKCNAYYDTGNHILKNDTNTGKVKCKVCEKEFGTFAYNVIKIPNTLPIEYQVDTIYKFSSEVTFREIWNPLDQEIGYTNIFVPPTTLQLVNKKSDSEFTIRATIKYKDIIKKAFGEYFVYWVTIGNKRVEVQDPICELKLFPDDVPPVIEAITMNNSENLTEWSRTKPITISGTENYCKNLKVKILDVQENIIFGGEAVVDNNGNYSISCTPDVQCDTNGRTFKAIITDTCENSIEKEFVISKVDSVSPEPISGTDITGDWSKSKKFTFKAIDSGVGNVSIAFQNIEDLNKAILNENGEYVREYEFIGDVYVPKELPVLYQDGLGNMCMQNIIINKIDNTSPTIVNAVVHNNIVIIDSNDRHKRLGEGSGVIKYRYITSDRKLENPTISKENSIEVSSNNKIAIDKIYEVKYVYIVAEDLVRKCK